MAAVALYLQDEAQRGEAGPIEEPIPSTAVAVDRIATAARTTSGADATVSLNALNAWKTAAWPHMRGELRIGRAGSDRDRTTRSAWQAR